MRVSFTVKELSRSTGIPKATIYTWIRQGRLKALRVGSRKITVPIGEAEKLGIRQDNTGR
ncbi:MAG: helix-turn-helix domain-containing protein [Moorellaceae bacterium]